MQISGNHSGFNFKSVYESVVTRHSSGSRELAPAAAKSADLKAESQQEDDAHAAFTLRETQLLQAAQRSAERTANQLSATADL